MNKDDLTALLFALVVFVTCCGCSSERSAVATSHSDSTYVYTQWLDSLVRSTYHKDSVYIRDSIFVYKSGDTVTVEKYSVRDRWRTRYDTLYNKIEVHDTAYTERCDTLWRTVTKEKELSTWQKVRMTVGDVALVLLCVAAVVAAVVVCLKKYKR